MPCSEEMVMATEYFGSSDEDELATTSPRQQPFADRPAKRRKLNSSEYGSDPELSAEDEGKSFDSSQTLAQDDQGENLEADEETEKAKPKSKYKIHIPKNAELPTDAFFTQPPQRSPSPYRIDQFHWRKSRKASSPPPPQRQPLKQQASVISHVSTTSAVAKLPSHDPRM